MICTVQHAKSIVSFGTMTDEQIADVLSAIETSIRSYTNNNFQNRNIRFVAPSVSHVLYGMSPFILVGDTIQISDSLVNDGLCVVTSINGNNSITVDRELFDIDSNLITKIEYPDDVVSCALNMAKWKMEKSDKVGLKSETLSRHSVTFEDSSSFVLGYPKALFSSIDRYRKARC